MIDMCTNLIQSIYFMIICKFDNPSKYVLFLSYYWHLFSDSVRRIIHGNHCLRHVLYCIYSKSTSCLILFKSLTTGVYAMPLNDVWLSFFLFSQKHEPLIVLKLSTVWLIIYSLKTRCCSLPFEKRSCLKHGRRKTLHVQDNNKCHVFQWIFSMMSAGSVVLLWLRCQPTLWWPAQLVTSCWYVVVSISTPPVLGTNPLKFMKVVDHQAGYQRCPAVNT